MTTPKLTADKLAKHDEVIKLVYDCQDRQPGCMSRLSTAIAKLCAQIGDGEPAYFVVIDEEKEPAFVTNRLDFAHEHINECCITGVENAGKWKVIPVFRNGSGTEKSISDLLSSWISSEYISDYMAQKLKLEINDFFASLQSERDQLKAENERLKTALEIAQPTAKPYKPGDRNPYGPEVGPDDY